MVRQGTFRDDLYDRLNMFSIWVPPLRARLEDIPLLVDYFISDCVGQAKRLVTGAAQQVLDLFQQYSWPGNIRELRNVVKRGVFTGKTEWIRQEDLRSRAAVLLGLTRNKFYKLLKLHGLDGESSRNGPGESDWIQ